MVSLINSFDSTFLVMIIFSLYPKRSTLSLYQAGHQRWPCVSWNIIELLISFLEWFSPQKTDFLSQKSLFYCSVGNQGSKTCRSVPALIQTSCWINKYLLQFSVVTLVIRQYDFNNNIHQLLDPSAKWTREGVRVVLLLHNFSVQCRLHFVILRQH